MSLFQQLWEGSKVGAIIFVPSDEHDERTLAAFEAGARLFGLDSVELLKKLVVVLPSARHGLYSTAGMRTFRFDGKPDSAALLLTVLLDGVRRHASFEPVILPVGYTGHGKSQLLNVLLGEDVLPVGKDTLGSTTKVVRRVQWNALDIETASSYTIAFHDTPGFGDTTYNDRVYSGLLMRRYKEQFYSGNAYPNIILLVVSWSSITLDAQNAPHQFTSPLGDTVNHLQRYGLLDVSPERCNVLTVVTKSLSSWSEFDDYETCEEKEKHWRVEAATRCGIITTLQRRLFPRSRPWSVVFVENDSGQRSRDIRLPNGEVGYQKLWEAISGIVEQSSIGKGDRKVAVQALHSISHASSSLLVTQLEQKVLVDSFGERPLSDTAGSAHAEMGGTTLQSDALMHSSSRQCPKRIADLAHQYLGVTYNPTNGLFGNTPILDIDFFHHRLISHSKRKRKTKAFTVVVRTLKSPQTRMQRTFSSRLFQGRPLVVPVPGVERHYANWPAFIASLEDASRIFACQLVTAGAWIHRHKKPRVSRGFRDVIAELPRWSESDEVSRNRYHDFFSLYGTHVVLRVALGGIVRVVVTDRRGIKGKGVKGHRKVGENVLSRAALPQGRPDIYVFQEGGSSVASELVASLEEQFKQRPLHSNSYPWPSHALLSKWIDALEGDPVFCPDNDFTLYAAIHTLGGLASEQRKDLESASLVYIRSIRPGESRDPEPPLEQHLRRG